MSMNLQYNYAQVQLTGECVGCATFSYEINHELYVEVPVATNDYIGKYYNRADGIWYLDSSFQTVWSEAPTWD